jgi:hypothetical protein
MGLFGFGKRSVEKKPRSGNKLNMIIARTYQLSSRLVGMQLTSGNFIGIVLSMTQMSLGFLFISSGLTKGIWYMIAMVVIIGCALAILVERLSIGGLAAVRESTEKKKKFEDNFYARAVRRDPTPLELENKDRKIKEFDKEIKAGWAFGGLGMGISIIVGDMFWHELFASLGDWYITFPISGLCAAVITLTFVHSELFQRMLVQTLKAILRDMHLMKTAVGVEQENMQLDMLSSAMATVRESEEVRLPIEAKIGRVVVKRLGGFADNFTELSIDEENAVESLPPAPPLKQLAAPRPRGEYLQKKAELQQFLQDNPGASIGQIAIHFGKSKSTIADWMNKHRAGL